MGMVFSESDAKGAVVELLRPAGVQLNGDYPWDIRVHDPRVYKRILRHGSLGLGEAYMDGWWDCQSLDEMFARLLRAGIDRKVPWNLTTIWHTLSARLVNLPRLRAFAVGERHYDVGNDLYKAMLDSRLAYTCGYWADATTLEQAQLAKLDLVCRKLGLHDGDRILDIGSGWGSFILYAAQRFHATCTGVTVSLLQCAYANTRAHRLPSSVPPPVTLLQDYQDTQGTYDHVVSLGMFEHVGAQNHRSFLREVRRLLRPGGLFLLHTIGSSRTKTAADPWISKYIFPNSLIPSARQLTDALEGLFVIEDWHNFGPDYDRTLMAWFGNFDQHWHRNSLFREKYGERFYRMWKYYLLVSAASFRARTNQLWQLVLSPDGIRGGYHSVR